ncbi:MAG: amidohydrolase [Clostridia bacterium]|nr:MAG: amidohydrolase [Clostridia bacterium]
MAKVKGIDMHVHPPAEEFEVNEYEYLVGKEFLGPVPVMKTEFGGHTGVEKMVNEFEDLKLAGLLVGWDTETATGVPPLPNDYVAELCRRYPDIFIGFGSVDPWKGKRAIDEVDRCVNELGLCGIKFHQIAQRFYPNDKRFYPLWEKCAELKAPVIFHMGQTGWRAGIRGGGGNYLDYSKPIPYVDQIAADFPELDIICAHPAFPWEDEALSMAQSKTNIYRDLSGWLPKYFSPNLIQYARTLLKDRCTFGSDYPVMSPRRWLEDFENLNFPEEVKKKIMLTNATKILKHPNAQSFVQRVLSD